MHILFLDPFHDVDDQAAIVALAKRIACNPSLAKEYKIVICGEFPAECVLSTFEVLSSICGPEIAAFVNLVAAPAYANVITNSKNVILSDGLELTDEKKSQIFVQLLNYYLVNQEQNASLKQTLLSVIASFEQRLASNPELQSIYAECFAKLPYELQQEYLAFTPLAKSPNTLVANFLCDAVVESSNKVTFALCAQTDAFLVDERLIDLLNREERLEQVIVQGQVDASMNLGGFNSTSGSKNLDFLSKINAPIVVIDTTLAKQIAKYDFGLEDLAEYPYLFKSALFYMRDKETQWLFRFERFARAFANKMRERYGQLPLAADVDPAKDPIKFNDKPDFKSVRKSVIDELIDEELMHPMLYGFATDYKLFDLNRYVNNFIDSNNPDNYVDGEFIYQEERAFYVNELEKAIYLTNPFAGKDLVEVKMPDGTIESITKDDWKSILNDNLGLDKTNAKYKAFQCLLQKQQDMLCNMIENIVSAIRTNCSSKGLVEPKRQVVLYDVPVALYDLFKEFLGNGRTMLLKIADREINCLVFYYTDDKTKEQCVSKEQCKSTANLLKDMYRPAPAVSVTDTLSGVSHVSMFSSAEVADEEQHITKKLKADSFSANS